jgi:Mitochondrial ribosomal protein L31
MDRIITLLIRLPTRTPTPSAARSSKQQLGPRGSSVAQHVWRLPIFNADSRRLTMVRLPPSHALRPSTHTPLFHSHRKDPYRLSSSRKSRVRERLRNVDELISTITSSGVQCGALGRAQALTSEANMRPKDKYTTYSPQGRGFRKSVHKVCMLAGL